MEMGTFVCPVEDKKHKCLAIVVYDHSKEGMNGTNTIKWLSDGHISLRHDDELKILTTDEFCRSWCKKQIGYH